MNSSLSAVPVLFLLSAGAAATPTVNGDTISWPDDGWYQVQDEQTYTEVCGGTRSCTVTPGSYVVINHSTGERFKDITVDGGNPLPAPEGLRISVYSNTAAEVFWNRASTPGLHYEISLDGEPLGASDQGRMHEPLVIVIDPLSLR